ncbi:retrovirus-related pol polyprotein from transposon TNT 1-94 [Tanacetum coccineum]
MQSQDIQINPVQAMDDSLIVSKSSLIESENHNAFNKSEIEISWQRQEEKVNMREAVDAGLVVTESSSSRNSNLMNLLQMMFDHSSSSLVLHQKMFGQNSSGLVLHLDDVYSKTIPATKHATPKKPTTTTPVKQSKPAPPPTKKPSKRKLPQKVRKGKPTFQLVDEDDEAQQESIPLEEDDDPDLEMAKKMSLEAHQEKGEGEGDDADMERAIKLSLDPAFLPQGRAPVGGVTIRDPVSETTSKLHEVVGKGKAVVTEEQVAHSLIDLSKKKRTTDQFILVRRDQTPHDSTTGPSSQPEDDTSEKVIHESSSTSDSERTESETETAAPKGDKDQGEVDSSTVTSRVSIPVSVPEKAHEALAGLDPKPMQEDQTGSNSGKLHVSLAGPNPEHMDDEFLATAYPKVHENLKLITDERVIDDKPESHSGSMSSMKNLDDTFNFGDQFLYDKPTEDDQEKSKVREESDSTIPDPSHQTVTSTPPVIAPFTDVSSSKPSLLVTPPPINTEATTITTSLPEITPFIALQLRVARLEQEMSEVDEEN